MSSFELSNGTKGGGDYLMRYIDWTKKLMNLISATPFNPSQELLSLISLNIRSFASVDKFLFEGIRK